MHRITILVAVSIAFIASLPISAHAQYYGVPQLDWQSARCEAGVRACISACFEEGLGRTACRQRCANASDARRKCYRDTFINEGLVRTAPVPGASGRGSIMPSQRFPHPPAQTGAGGSGAWKSK